MTDTVVLLEGSTAVAPVEEEAQSTTGDDHWKA